MPVCMYVCWSVWLWALNKFMQIVAGSLGYLLFHLKVDLLDGVAYSSPEVSWGRLCLRGGDWFQRGVWFQDVYLQIFFTIDLFPFSIQDRMRMLTRSFSRFVEEYRTLEFWVCCEQMESLGFWNCSLKFIHLLCWPLISLLRGKAWAESQVSALFCWNIYGRVWHFSWVLCHHKQALRCKTSMSERYDFVTEFFTF